jgi:ADP-ribose pyrophosphatase
MDATWETLSTAVAYDCAGFEVINETVELPDGTTSEFDYLAEPPSVVVLPFVDESEETVVAIEEWREPVGRLNHGLPAGGLEPEESPPAAAKRELREETGYVAGSIEQLTTIEPANGYADSVFHYVVARDCTPASEQQLDTDETITVELTTFDELLAAVRDDQLRDGRSAYAVLYYALFGTADDQD